MFRNFVHMLRYCRPYRSAYAKGALALFIVDLLDAFAPKLMQWAIEDLETASHAQPYVSPLHHVLPDAWVDGASSGEQRMALYAMAYVAVVVIAGGFRYSMSLTFSRAGVDLIHHLRLRFFSHLQSLQASYHDEKKTGAHLSLSTSDMDSCRMFYGLGLLLGLDTIFYFILIPLYMVTVSWKLTLASVVCLPLIPFIVSKLSHTIETRYERVQEKLEELSERARESFAGAKVVKSFVQEDTEAQSFAKLARDYMGQSLTFARVMTLENPLLTLMLGLADVVVVAYGGYLVQSGEISVGQFAAFFQYLVRLSGPMISLGWVITLFQRGHVSLERIEAVLNTEPLIKEPSSRAPLQALHGHIEFRSLTFAYREGAPPVLRDISLDIAPGKTIGIVGPIGSGKSTLLHLIPRLYDARIGSVVVDGYDVSTISLDILRRDIAVVPQETFLFSETILDNIALGSALNTDVDWSRRCAQASQIDADIMALPKQYQTLLGEKGVNLSGGQKQRVAIARALARKPAIMLFDDCLSAVDTQTEAAILSELRSWTRNLTTIIVSHRLSSVLHADEIVVLQEGRITERGTHSELASGTGYYADLCRKQYLEHALDETVIA